MGRRAIYSSAFVVVALMLAMPHMASAQCMSDDECSSHAACQATCDTMNMRCNDDGVDCTELPGTPFCDVSLGCVECIGDGDCVQSDSACGPTCSDGMCVGTNCAANDTAILCDTENDVCVACLEDADCNPTDETTCGAACDVGVCSSGADCSALPGLGCGSTCDADTLVCTSRTDCAFCGDGELNNLPTEECDPGRFCVGGDNDGAVCGAASECPNGTCEILYTEECDVDCSFAFCGDGDVNMAAGEECEPMLSGANDDLCDDDCTLPVCGDGLLNEAAGEFCDDGNNDDGDGCDAMCVLEFCGDGIRNNDDPTTDDIDETELCDDGNTDAGDGCNEICWPEDGWICSGFPSVCDGVCGDGIWLEREACDDGNTDEGDGCSTVCGYEDGWACSDFDDPLAILICQPATGDGLIVGFERCDDGNQTPDDGCHDGFVTRGYLCMESPSVCHFACGDGIVNNGENCDDGNNLNGDGCSPGCSIEDAWTCIDYSDFDDPLAENICVTGGVPNGELIPIPNDCCTVIPEEECDDGNDTPGDGCFEGELEEGYICTRPCITDGSCPDDLCGPILVCGDGDLDPGEECDDGNDDEGDCCNRCQVEMGCACDADGCGADIDGDRVRDAVDNCPDVENPRQVDTNTDGTGDACSEDPDGDGFTATDNCPLVPNGDQANFDEDEHGDLCDVDDDNDGLSDEQERRIGTDPFNVDTDGDGLSDLAEFLTDEDPLSESSLDTEPNTDCNCSTSHVTAPAFPLLFVGLLFGFIRRRRC